MKKKKGEEIPEFAPTIEPPFRELLATGEPLLNVELSGEIPKEPGTQRFWIGSFFPIRDQDDGRLSIGGVVLDITDRKRAEEQIEASLREKEVLLREIHHRVKNNMQVIVSLLRMHARRSESQELLGVFDDCRDRINAMSLIHQALYESEDLARIDFQVYLTKLCGNLGRAYRASGKMITVTVESCDVSLGMDQGIAVGMVICELVTNAFKHAFPDRKSGTVSVGMSRLDEEFVELIVQDNGIGLRPDIDLQNPPSLGLELAIAAVTGELGGNIVVERDAGTRFVIRFKCKNA